MVETLEPAGLGALMALVEERKKKLAAEGLFDAARKQLLPFLPEVIGVVTSPTGAVIRDILHRLADRFPRHVLVWPVRVQGEGSADEVAAAIRGFNALAPAGRSRKPDLLIVARGGGSLEDLWSFNEEIVVRAAAESMIPLISAVGHETDVTLIDFAADKRAPTPTAAAEMAVPVRAELMVRLDSLARRSLACWQRCQEARRTELRAAARALAQRRGTAGAAAPAARSRGGAAAARAHRQCADPPPGILARRRPALAAHVAHARGASAASSPPRWRNARRADAVARLRRRERLGTATARLAAGLRANADAHRNRIGHARERVTALIERADRAVLMLLHQRATAVERCGQLLAALSHRGVLARGFALVRDLDGHPLRNAAAISPAQRLDIEFSDGRVQAVAEGSSLEPAAKPAPRIRPRPRRRGGHDPGQGNLFGS